MDPASALGVASSAIQIFDFSAKLWSKIRELYESESGMSSAHGVLQSDAERLREMNSGLSQLLTPDSLNRELTAMEETVVSICNDCDNAAEQLVLTLQDLSLNSSDEEDAVEADCSHRAQGSQKRKRPFARNLPTKRRRPLDRQWSAVQGAVKEMWRRKDVNRLCERLEESKRALANAILVNMQHEVVAAQRTSRAITARLDTNWSTAKTFGDWLQTHRLDTSQGEQNLIAALQQQSRDSASRHHNLNPGSSAAMSGNGILKPWSSSSQCISDWLLDRLHFPVMYDRQERIPDSYQGTFEWIYSEPEDQDMSWDSFSSWLTIGRGIYWITGKAGSGKSTLMRMLEQCQQTERALRKWAEDLSLITASFFFWNSGSELQMSQDGLLRSVLWQILEQRLSRASPIFLKKLEVIALSLESSQIQVKDLLQLFRLVVEEESQNVRYFLLLDGLDEFHGDISQLVSLVHTLGAYDNVKICVSSRPWTIFEDGFRQQPSLVLQQLTHGDILLYTRENLQKQPAFREMEWADPDTATRLIENITQKASGVFLWVVLVVSSLIKGLADGDRVRDLQARLDEIPDELEDLFRKMLHGLEGRYFQDAARLFQIHDAARWEGFAFDSDYVVPLLAYSFADEFGDDRGKAISWPLAPMTPKECFMRSVSMKRRLNSRCNGLLEIGEPARRTGETWKARYRNLDKLIAEAESGDVSVLPTLHSYGQELAKSSVQYLHRTVKDYLESPDIWSMIENVSGSDIADHWIMSLCLAHLYLWKASSPSPPAPINTWTTQIDGANGHWNMFKDQDFRSMLERYISFSIQFLPQNKSAHCELLDTLSAAIAHDNSQRLVWNQLGVDESAIMWYHPHVSTRLDDFLSLAVHCNLFEYVDRTLSRAPLDSREVSRLLTIAVLKRTSLLITAPNSFADSESDNGSEDDSDDNTDNDSKDGSDGRSGDSDDDWLGNRNIDGPNSHMVDILLRHQADPDCNACGVTPRQLLERREQWHGVSGNVTTDSHVYEEIWKLFAEWTPRKKTFTGFTTKAKKIFK